MKPTQYYTRKRRAINSRSKWFLGFAVLMILLFLLIDGLFLTTLIIVGPIIVILFVLALTVKDRPNGFYYTYHKKYK